MGVRLTSLNPRWANAGGEGIRQPGPDPCPTCKGTACDECHRTGRQYVPAPLRIGVSLLCDCPCGNKDEGHMLHVPFDIPLDGKPWDGHKKGWHRVGETFDTLTLTPSILRIGGCGWHGFITNGEVITC